MTEVSSAEKIYSINLCGRSRILNRKIYSNAECLFASLHYLVIFYLFVFNLKKYIQIFSIFFFHTANNWRLRTSLLLSHGVWTEASQIDISLCLSVRPGHELELCKPVKVMFAPKPVKRAVA